ncbi:MULTISPECIES: tripartite tricarboxylate transporter TctB family protein [Thalassobaculum]|uniref:Tripartite tricarboxylate transporter TctB family protein n=1 Tax=Thalassobaculum litoreum DSM 18839 TaxID=1123362 RepID=A0A8G2BLW4_9PROT|nr:MULTISPECIES: tripartite tricarboxylate transporter TctB family protein [Thalassobaculum]SDG46260.1 Tripartite tricarboxylate transporter TctB family protein [Thalassobaculum litoreum DSM 18839]
MSVSRDTIVAILLLAFCGVLWYASYDIEITSYGTMPSSVWPRIIIVAMAVFSALLLLKSLSSHDDAPVEEASSEPFFRRYRNAAIIYALFLLFLLTLPTLGMHLGGALFVFLSLTALGRPSPKLIALHAAIAVISIGAMWSIFTFGLRVILPQGEILPI